ncbi:hypothetical protein AU492_08395 [Lonsdalea populi]|uniref:Uncharacterized protein n=1 Tax=Lonsdalea populi TaxID=1172565 RepID=A0ABX9ER74_9GAMM|nr:hypothetical protein AU487_05195 [Lonsdalea populi]RAT34417.1 hypothetical protein AU492_08395 [Lonsdalea populi]
MTPGPVVEHFNVIEDIGAGQIAGFIYTLSDTLFFQRTEERLCYGIDAQQLPRRLMLGARLLARQKRRQSSLPYWLP